MTYDRIDYYDGGDDGDYDDRDVLADDVADAYADLVDRAAEHGGRMHYVRPAAAVVDAALRAVADDRGERVAAVAAAVVRSLAVLAADDYGVRPLHTALQRLADACDAYAAEHARLRMRADDAEHGAPYDYGVRY